MDSTVKDKFVEAVTWLEDESFGGTNIAQTAAILVLADVLGDALGTGDELSHQICMGVRKGMFGVNATDDASINGSRQ